MLSFSLLSSTFIVILLSFSLNFFDRIVQIPGCFAKIVLSTALFAAANAAISECSDSECQCLCDLFPVSQLCVESQTSEVQMNRLEDEENETSQKSKTWSKESANS